MIVEIVGLDAEMNRAMSVKLSVRGWSTYPGFIEAGVLQRLTALSKNSSADLTHVCVNQSERACEGVFVPVQETQEWQVGGVQWCSCAQCLHSRNNEAL